MSQDQNPTEQGPEKPLYASESAETPEVGTRAGWNPLSGAQAGAESFEADTCRPVEIDGETIRVHGASEMSEESRAALTEVIRAAKRRYAAEQARPTARQLSARAVNAVLPALRAKDEWLPFSVRRAIADAVLAVVQPELDRERENYKRLALRLDVAIGRAEDAEAAIDRVRALATDMRGSSDTRWLADQLTAALQPPAPAHDAGPSVAECADNDRAHWNDKYAGEGA
ncbi:hypothetical protein ABZ876_08235 [Streptomyces sp. NPDC046931]|uniref:hypothetical protein n=1 Tax=Streptomyces sp. NPDC046931 TaxID=3154806 RepID=UPI0034110C26